MDGLCRAGIDGADVDDGDDVNAGGDADSNQGDGGTDADTGDDTGEDPEEELCPDAPTCEDLDAQCGSHPDGCGGFIHCGSCGDGFICGTDEQRGQCLEADCSPISDCSGTGFVCGSIPDGCGGTISCGVCDDTSYCGTGDQFGACLPLSACTPTTCEDAGVGCGRIPDGCGQFLECGVCPSGEACDGGQCKAPQNCQPASCAELDAQCGQQPDGCGGLTVDCGTCPGEHVCGIGVDAGKCVPNIGELKSCADYNANCGILPDGRGGTINCGSCTAPEICGGSGIANVCGAENTGPCQGELCQHQRYCTGGAATTVTGTVYAPDGKLPLPNAVVYVPGVPLNQLPTIPTGTGICQRCEDEDLGDPIAGAVSDFDGTFELKHVPADVPFPLVIKVGKWRRVVMIDPVPACQTRSLAAEQTRLPTRIQEGSPHDHIPKIAITTGSVDAMECVFYKLGVENSQFTLPPTPGQPNVNFGGPIHLYRANGGIHSDLASVCPNNSCPCTDRTNNCSNATLTQYLAYQLYEDENRLHSYDMIVSDCEASAQNRSTANKNRMRAYLNDGGRLFASHFSHDWLVNNGDLQDVFTAGSGSSSASRAVVDTGHGRGQTFWNWLNIVNAIYNSNNREVYVYMPRGLVRSTDSNLATRWVYMPDSSGYNPRNTVQQFSFDTPVYPPAGAPQCGRVAYSGFHVASTASGGQVSANGRVFPTYCTSGELSAQEKILAYMLFDLAACISDTGEPPPPVCHPRSCEDIHPTDYCGIISDGCGEDLIDCGICPDGQICGAGGMPNVCGEVCTPLTCADHGVECGTVPDGCGGSLDCGDCGGNLQCGAGGTPNICACIELTCDDHGAECGQVSDGCGGTLHCGTCPDGIKCGGGGIANRCDSDCTPLTCGDHGAECGKLPDGCGGTIECGTCDSPESCGGAGQPNICGCMPLTCEDHGAQCGEVSDGCGGTLECGGCEGDMLCEDFQCVDPPCRPSGEECTRSSQCCSRICGAGICVVN